MLTIPKVTAAILRDDPRELNELLKYEALAWRSLVLKTKLTAEFMYLLPERKDKFVWVPFCLDLLKLMNNYEIIGTNANKLIRILLKDYSQRNWVRIKSEHSYHVHAFTECFLEGRLWQAASRAAVIYNASDVRKSQVDFHWHTNDGINRKFIDQVDRHAYLRNALLNAIEVARVRTLAPRRSRPAS